MARKLARIPLILVALYVVGVLVGQQFLRPPAMPQVASDHDSQASEPQTGRPPSNGEPAGQNRVNDAPVVAAANTVRQGDSLLLAGNPAAALRQYKLLAAMERGEPSDGLRYRMAVCAESLGNSEQALKEYQQLVSQSPTAPITAAARLGQVRVWCKLQRPTVAKQVLWKALLDDPGEEDITAGLHAEFAERLAQILAGQARAGAEPTLWMDQGIVEPPLPWSPEQALQWVSGREPGLLTASPEGTRAEEGEPAPEVTEVAPPSEQAEPSLEIAQRRGGSPDEIDVRGQVPEMSVAAALELLLQKAGLPVHWSDSARQAVSGRSVTFQVHDRPLANILDNVLDPLELLWEVRDQGLWVHVQDEASAESLRVFRAALAERQLRRVIATYPEHESTAEAYWALGNLAFDRGQTEAAAALYQQYLRQFPRSRTKSGVHFNLAKVHLLQGRREPAVQQLYHVVDDAAGARTMTAAFLYLGKLFLEDGHGQQAIKPLARGLALAQDKSDKAVAALTLAAAYLLGDNNPHAANQVLLEHRSVLGDEPYLDQAAFLAAWARFQASEGTSRAAVDGRSLVAALTHVKPDEFFGAHGFVLVARGYRSLEMLEEMKLTLLQGLSQPRLGGLRHHMLYEMAQYYRRWGDRDKCRLTLQSLIQEGGVEWTGRAKLELASVAFQAGDDADCLRICTQLLDTPGSETTQREVLRMVGRVLERQGDYSRAALCFAGISPPPGTITQPSEDQPQ